ncbi:APC family permease [Nonomuraea sp. NPDC050790]|uniref:APC family permease n=1 Tax=Nonomuraea sp. NPDC050790 TaxID=3364371 RepID=UPI0037B283D7
MAELGWAQGTALLVGGVLGPGVLALPHLAAAAAGPASIVAWAALLALSVPVALTFAALGERLPGGGGVAAFAGRAFGPRAAAAAGWWFLCAMPVGVLAGALIGAEYVVGALGSTSRGAVVAVAAALLAAAFAANHAGLRFSGRLQLALLGLLAVLLAAAVVLAIPSVRPAAFTPFAPHGWQGVGRAAGVLFFAFVGWEAASHLSGAFGRRTLVRATVLTLAVVTVLYLGLAVTTIGALGPRAATSPVPLTDLLTLGLGEAARPVTAVAALLLSFGAVNTYIAGGARLAATMFPTEARTNDRRFRPKETRSEGTAFEGATFEGTRFEGTRSDAAGRGLAGLAVVTAVLGAVVAWAGADLDALMRATSACLAAVTALGTAAGARLLTGGRRVAALAATGFTLLVLAACGPYLVIPAAIGALALSRRTAAASAR